MPKLQTKTIMAPEKDFLAFPDHYVNIPGLIAYAELTKLAIAQETVYGAEKVIPRGTVVHIDATGKVTKPTYVKSSNESGTKPNGILFNTVRPTQFDETDTHVNATVLVHGFVRKDRLHGDSENLDAPLIHVVSK